MTGKRNIANHRDNVKGSMDAAGMELSQSGGLLCSVNSTSTVSALRSNEETAWIPSDALDKMAVDHQMLKLLASADVPNDDGVIDRSAQESGAIGRPSQVADIFSMSAQPFGHIPFLAIESPVA